MALASTDLIAYVDGLELAEHPPAVRQLIDSGALAAPPAPPVDTEKPGASIAKGSLVAFTAGVSLRHRHDAINSTLLAQLASDKEFDRFNSAQIMEWYKKYIAVLGKVGWDVQELQFQNFEASGSTFTIDAAIVEIVSSFLAGPEVAVVQATLNSLSKLESNDPWYVVWDSSSHKADGGNFQIIPCADEAGKGDLVMGLSAYAFTTTETSVRFLWTNYNSSSTKLKFATQATTLDEDVYSQVRSAVIAKLGDNAITTVKELKI
jgi:hypothetical protein